MNATTVKRSELYRQVWEEPISRLAAKYGLSDVGLAKICRKYDIPRPPRGYWAKLQHGQSPRQIKLPDPDRDDEIELRPFQDPDAARAVHDLVAEQTPETDTKIEVAATLRGAHELVGLAREQLETAKTDDDRLILPPEDAALNLRLSKKSLRRALLVMDALLKAIEARGYRVVAGPSIQAFDVEVGFTISEKLERIREEAKDHDLDGDYFFGHSSFTEQHVPTGRLELRITDHSGRDYSRHVWRDGKTPIEGRLNDFVQKLIEAAAYKKKRADDWAHSERVRQEKAAQREKQRQLYKEEKARVEELEREANAWFQSQTIRRYIEAVRQQNTNVDGAIENRELADWIEWANQQADRIDPLTESPPSVLDHPVRDDYYSW